MKIAVDAMGGDHGPAVVVEGAVAAVREYGASVILVGDRQAVEVEVERLGAQTLGLEIRHASEVVGMAESPSLALRRKRDSSLRVAAELVRDGKAAAFISAGNTGAAMAISMFVIGVLRGIDRPATQLPFSKAKGSVPVVRDVDVARLPVYQRASSRALWTLPVLLSVAHGEAMSPEFQEGFYDAVSTYVRTRDADAFADDLQDAVLEDQIPQR